MFLSKNWNWLHKVLHNSLEHKKNININGKCCKGSNVDKKNDKISTHKSFKWSLERSDIIQHADTDKLAKQSFPITLHSCYTSQPIFHVHLITSPAVISTKLSGRLLLKCVCDARIDTPHSAFMNNSMCGEWRLHGFCVCVIYTPGPGLPKGRIMLRYRWGLSDVSEPGVRWYL